MTDKYSEVAIVQDLAGVYLLDTRHMGNQGTVGVYLIPSKNNAKSFALVETGPGSSLSNLKEAINQAGFKLENLSDILVTHIHLDHAGAAGALAAESGAKVYVHEHGYKHLHDPSRLIASAKRIYKEKMDMLWGNMLATPEEQLVAVSGGEILDIVGHKIKVIYTPGHANHHVSFTLEDGSIFTGDSAAIKFAGSNIIRPAFPPPELNLEIWQESIEKMLAEKPRRLLLTHFGEVRNAIEHLESLNARHEKWANVVLEAMKFKKDIAAITQAMKEIGEAELEDDNAVASVAYRHAITSDYAMTVMGLERYWKKFHPEKVL